MGLIGLYIGFERALKGKWTEEGQACIGASISKDKMQVKTYRQLADRKAIKEKTPARALIKPQRVFFMNESIFKSHQATDACSFFNRCG